MIFFAFLIPLKDSFKINTLAPRLLKQPEELLRAVWELRSLREANELAREWGRRAHHTGQPAGGQAQRKGRAPDESHRNAGKEQLGLLEAWEEMKSKMKAMSSGLTEGRLELLHRRCQIPVGKETT